MYAHKHYFPPKYPPHYRIRALLDDGKSIAALSNFGKSSLPLLRSELNSHHFQMAVRRGLFLTTSSTSFGGAEKPPSQVPQYMDLKALQH